MYSVDDPTALTYCELVSKEEYEKQTSVLSQQALYDLLDGIISNRSMSAKEKRKKLKQVKLSNLLVFTILPRGVASIEAIRRFLGATILVFFANFCAFCCLLKILYIVRKNPCCSFVYFLVVLFFCFVYFVVVLFVCFVYFRVVLFFCIVYFVEVVFISRNKCNSSQLIKIMFWNFSCS